MRRGIRPRLITFDVTGTLLMTKLEEHYTEIGLRHGVSVEPRELARSFKQNFRRLSLEHPVYGKHTGLGWENWWRTIVHNVFRDQHRFIPETTLNKVANSLIECYSTSMCWHKYTGTTDLLECLKKHGVILAVISNFDERLEPILVDTKIRPYFSFVLTSYRFGVEKPSTSIFEEALRLSTISHGKKIAAREAVHIGDTIDSDYVGARNAGWNAILIKRDTDPIDDTKVRKEDVFHSLPELQAHLDTLLRNR